MTVGWPTKKVLLARQNQIKKSLGSAGGLGSWPVGMAVRLLLWERQNRIKKSLGFQLDSQRNRQPATPHPLKIFPPGLPDAGRQDRGKNFRPTTGPGLWAWPPKTRSGNERCPQPKSVKPVRKRTLSQDGSQNKPHALTPYGFI